MTPCKTCPWRRGSDAKLIPRFRLDLARSLAVTTCGPDDGFRQVMACHGEGDARPCIGYVVSDDGWRNLHVRILALRGALPVQQIIDDCAGLDLYPTYREALVNIERTWG